MTPPVNGNLDAKVTVRPKGTQVLLVALVVFAGVLAVCATILFLGTSPGAPWMLGASVAIAIGVACAWYWGKSDHDFENVHPTQFVATPNRVEIVYDSRVLSHENSLVIQKISRQILDTQTLPPPSGLTTGADATIVANSQSEAAQQVNEINVEIQRAKDWVIAQTNPAGVFQGGPRQAPSSPSA